MIVATAGHIDHGKTALVQALTGVDADRLPEEKRRGLTIDLGFAYSTLPDGSEMPAKVVGNDPSADVAVIQLDGKVPNLRPIAIGDSTSLRLGEVVLAVGNPLGVGQTVTMGIISAKGRSTGAGSGSYEDFLQTDAPINHGNSGGALVNTRGELVGINSQILSPSDGNIGIGFAIPANMAKHVMEDLRTTGKVTRGQLGVTVQNVNSDMAQSLGPALGWSPQG